MPFARQHQRQRQPDVPRPTDNADVRLVATGAGLSAELG